MVFDSKKCRWAIRSSGINRAVLIITCGRSFDPQITQMAQMTGGAEAEGIRGPASTKPPVKRVRICGIREICGDYMRTSRSAAARKVSSFFAKQNRNTGPPGSL